MPPILDARDLSKKYSGRFVVDKVSLTLNKGEVVGLLGPNGAGKTTTFFMIVGAIRPYRGTIFFRGRNISKLPMYRRAQMGMGFLPQEPSVFRKLTVAQNLDLVLQFQKLSKKERESRRDALLSDFSLSSLRRQKAYVLSGGEQRRLEIARSLATEPKLVLLDEPFTGIDPIAMEEIEQAIAFLKAQQLPVLITDHNVQATLRIVDRAYILHEGNLLTHGTRREIAEHPLARKYYLGERFRLDP